MNTFPQDFRAFAIRGGIARVIQKGRWACLLTQDLWFVGGEERMKDCKGDG